MEFIKLFISEYGTTILYAVLTALAGYIGIVAKRLYTKYVNDKTKQALMDYCRKNIAKYAMPYDIEFREDMPKTLVGKVAYRVLEEAELAKIKDEEEVAADASDAADKK